MSVSIQDWLDALRSGEYKQGYKQLRVNCDQFCCLGVLCDLFVKDGIGEWTGKTYMGYQTYLPESIKKAVGITTTLETRVAVLNDNGEDFTRIANYIEEFHGH